MPSLLNLSEEIGKKYNYLTITEDVGVEKGIHFVMTKCICGTIKKISYHKIKVGHTQSCSCFNKKRVIENQTTHGLSKHPLFRVWAKIKDRCYNHKSHAYKNYGGRGIKVCNEWLNDFKSFYDWCIANGWERGLETDRIDNDGNYEPGNCRFVTHIINNRNKRTNVYLSFNGLKKTMTEWSEITRIPVSTIKGRLNKMKWTVEEALSISVNKKYSPFKK